MSAIAPTVSSLRADLRALTVALVAEAANGPIAIADAAERIVAKELRLAILLVERGAEDDSPESGCVTPHTSSTQAFFWRLDNDPHFAHAVEVLRANGSSAEGIYYKACSLPRAGEDEVTAEQRADAALTAELDAMLRGACPPPPQWNLKL